MSSGVLLDTHALIWLGQSVPLSVEAALLMARAIEADALFGSHISIWEMGVASTKKQIHLVPDLGGRTPHEWFNHTVASVGAQALPISAEIAAEAALVPAIYGSGDPGDCFLTPPPASTISLL